MNNDIKIQNEILVNRIQYHIKTIIYYGQIEFTAEMQKWFNIRIFTYTICHFNKCKEKS